MPKKKRDDKIFNNSYYHGKKTDSKNEIYHFENKIETDRTNILNQTASGTGPDEQYPYNKIQEVILKLVDENEDIQDILTNNKKKFNKQKINNLFEITLNHFNTSSELRKIKVYVYIFDVVSRLTGIKALNLFDLLEIDFKTLLLDELNETHSIYEDFNKDNKLF